MGVFNAERYLVEAMGSILNQSFSDFEFVILNDGSTDKSGEILRVRHHVIHAFGCSAKSDAD